MGLSLIVRSCSPLKRGKNWNTRCLTMINRVLLYFSFLPLSYVRLVSIILPFLYLSPCVSNVLLVCTVFHLLTMQMPLGIYPACIHELHSKITSQNHTPTMQPYPNSIQCNAILNAPANRVTLLEHSHPPCKPHNYSTRWDLNRRAELDLVFSIPSIRK
jgi:hypothetical protein